MPAPPEELLGVFASVCSDQAEPFQYSCRADTGSPPNTAPAELGDNLLAAEAAVDVLFYAIPVQLVPLYSSQPAVYLPDDGG